MGSSPFLFYFVWSNAIFTKHIMRDRDGYEEGLAFILVIGLWGG